VNVETFNQDFYERIWGTVHRHEYCQHLAESLVKQYGKCRILDIGTGCGHLVKCLRDLGCDGWGLEVSEYAIQNSCCHDFVRRGDIRDIPFASNRFDVVHSNGVWGYFPECDIQGAWLECKRVGKIQHHNIDYDDADPDHGLVLVKSRAWWDNQFHPKILVACPTHEVKSYAMSAWVERAKSLTYPNLEFLLVDNSNTPEPLAHWGNIVPLKHINPPNGVNARINAGMEEIRRHFLAGDCSRWFNMEIDTIPDPDDVIERMLSLGGDADWISHAYPGRGGPEEDAQQGIGCSLLSRRMMAAFGFSGAGDSYAPDGWLWAHVRPARKFTTTELWGRFKVKHLAA
jgi:ubiquinone/menaquinone biosynthesis C-methylase UbiE